jgi:ribosomal protein L16/L10AE
MASPRLRQAARTALTLADRGSAVHAGTFGLTAEATARALSCSAEAARSALNELVEEGTAVRVRATLDRRTWVYRLDRP